MEIIYFSIVTTLSIPVIWVLTKVLNWVYLTPKKLEKHLRQQGLNGTSYKLLFGDVKENATMVKEATSKPIGLTNDIVTRAIPHVQNSVQTYGKNSFAWIGTTPRVNIVDPEMVKDILNDNFKFQKPKINPLLKLLSNGVGLYEGEKWAKHRKIIDPAFHIQKLKHMVPAMYLSCDKMTSEWKAMLYPNDSCEVDVWPYFEMLASDVISRTAFGSNYEEGQKIFHLQREQAQHLSQIIATSYLPGWRFLPTKRNRRMKEINKEAETLLWNIINKRLKAMKKGESSNFDDLLGLLLESNSKAIEQNNKKFGMTINEVIQECKAFYFVGQETTSVLLTWTMVMLSWHPSWQHKAREEVFQVFGDQTPDFDGLNRLKIVTSIFYEVMRLYPPLVMLIRATTEETKLGELSLPVGVMLALPIILIHHDLQIWGEDVKEFKPERFYDGISKATKNGMVAYFPFAWGPRICIGQNFAMLEAKMALAMILQRFSFELSPSYSHAPQSVITLQPQYGAHLILRKV